MTGLAMSLPSIADMHTPLAKSVKPDGRTKEERIAAAMAAGPLEIAKDAKIV